mgnify:FL=1
MKEERNENTDGEMLPARLMAADAEDLYGRAMKMMWSVVNYKDMQMTYSCALREIKTKFDVLNTEFNIKYKRNPISSISTRLKSTESTVRKLISKNLSVSVENIEANIFDIAGIRVICSYIDDIYEIAEALLKQDDITLIRRKDYIQNPKPNGYRSLHLIVSIPVFFAEGKKEVNVEVQIRTIAMDFWASLEHQLKYKRQTHDQAEVVARLKNCADIIARTDAEMLDLRRKIEQSHDAPTEEDELIERLKKIDVRMD